MPRASLPMYDLPEVRRATDALWDGIAAALRAEGLAAPPLDHQAAPEAVWGDPALLLSQSCGYPLLHGFAGRLQPVATPCYAAPGCAGPLYRSAVLVRADNPARHLEDLRGCTCAVNSWDSQSGWNALSARIAPLAREGRFFGAALLTGSHAASIAAVAAGMAACAAVDAVTLALLRRHRPPAVADLRLLAWTGAAPGLPLVTRAAAGPAEVAALRRALAAALTDPALADARAALLLRGAAWLGLADYRPVLEMRRAAGALARPPQR